MPRSIGECDGVDMAAVVAFAELGGSPVAVEALRLGKGAQAEVFDPRDARFFKARRRRVRKLLLPRSLPNSLPHNC